MKKSIVFLLMIAALCAAGQQPQTQTAPIYPVNSKYVNGVAPGYAPTAGSGLTLNLGGGTANCGGAIAVYIAGTLTMTASTTNYVYLNTAASCVPAIKTTAFTSSDIALATVVTGSSAITSITDDRTMFISGAAGTAGPPNGSPQFNAGGAFAGELQVFEAQSGDTISSIETECSSLCVYKLSSPQTITLSGSHVMSSNVVVEMQPGGFWTVNGSGFSLTGIQILGSSALTPHFGGTAALGFAANVAKAEVEWFGATAAGSGGSDNTAAFQACVNTGVVQCEGQIGVYRVDGPVNFTTNNSGFAGKSYGQPFQGGGTALVSTSATNTILNIAGSGAGSRIYWNKFSDFSVYRSVVPATTSKNISVQYTLGTNIQRVQSFEGGYNYYFLAPANLIFRDDIGGHGYFQTETGSTNTYYDAFVDSAAGAPPQSAHFSNFIASTNLTGSGTPITSCFVLNGVQISDLFSDWLQCSGTNYGIEILDANGGGFHASDIHFTHSVLDAIRTSAIYAYHLFGTDNSSVEFAGGWANCIGVSKCVDVESSGGVTFTSVQALERPSSTNTGEFYIHGSSYIQVNNLNCQTVSAANSCVVLDGSIESSLSGGTYQSGNGSSTSVIFKNSSSGNSILGVAFGGVMGNAISADNTSNHNHYLNLNSFGASVSVPISDAGADNQFSGSSSLNGHGVAAVLACADTSGSGAAQSCTTSPSFTPASGDCVLYTTTTANIGTGLTLNVNSLGAKSVSKWLGTTTLVSGDMPANKPVLACYDGTNWNLSTIGNAPSGGTGSGVPTCADTSGSGAAQSCTTSPSFTPSAGSVIVYSTTTANTGTGLTVNVNSLGAKSVAKWQSSTTLAAGDIAANKQVLMTYDGTNWELSTIGNAPSGGGGASGNFVLLESHTVSGANEQDFTSFYSSSYSNYQVELTGITPSTTGETLTLQMGNSSCDTTSGHYTYGQWVWASGGQAGPQGSSSSANVVIYPYVGSSSPRTMSSNAQYATNGYLLLENLGSTTASKSVHGELNGGDSAASGVGQQTRISGSFEQTTGPVNIVCIKSTGGNFSGFVAIYGKTN